MRSASRFGAGALVGERLVVTHYGMVNEGRDVEVELRSGQVIPGDTVLVDDETGLALVRLEWPGESATPLALDQDEVPSDAELRMHQPARDGSPDPQTRWVSVPAPVASQGGEDPLVTPPVAAVHGAPVVRAGGGLVGLAEPFDDDVYRVVPAKHIAALLARFEERPEDRFGGETWFLLRPGWTFQARFDGENRVLHGPTFGIGALLDDRVLLEARVAVLGFGGEHGDRVVSRKSSAILLEAALGYRFLLTSPNAPATVHLTPILGFGYENLSVVEHRLQMEGGELVDEKTTPVDGRDTALLTARLELTAGEIVTLGLEGHLDVTDMEESRAGLYIGLGF